MKSKILVNTVIVTATLMTMIGVISYATGQELSAQNMTEDPSKVPEPEPPIELPQVPPF
jgi:hypothetical protein